MERHTDPLDLVGLSALMELTSGRAEVAIGLVDGPVDTSHPELAAPMRELRGGHSGSCLLNDSAACTHGTLVAGVLGAARSSAAPGICPDCTLVVQPVFTEADPRVEQVAGTTPYALATALVETVDAGVRVVNVSSALVRRDGRGEREVERALDHARHRGVIVVAAAGNQATVGATPLTRHPWVLPVAACDPRGHLLGYTNLGRSISTRGLSAPGTGIVSLGSRGGTVSFEGTSAAAPFVTGTIALLCSEFPWATAVDVRAALDAPVVRRRTIAPPVLDAWGAYRSLTNALRRVVMR
jgi:subtilisin family serine protease